MNSLPIHPVDLALMNVSGDCATIPRRLVKLGPRRTPRPVEYTCSSCTDTYIKVTEVNAWWSTDRDICPHCKQRQYPVIDIETPLNAMELDPFSRAIFQDGEECGSALNTDTDRNTSCHTPHPLPLMVHDRDTTTITPDLNQRVSSAVAWPVERLRLCELTDCTGKLPDDTNSSYAKKLFILMSHAR